MAKHSRDLEVDEELDLEDMPYEERTEALDSFLAEVFDTTTKESELGMPSLKDLKEKFKTKSAMIRYLHIERKFKVKDIAKHLGVKYQHVRNVLTNELKRGPNEPFRSDDWEAPILKGGA